MPVFVKANLFVHRWHWVPHGHELTEQQEAALDALYP